MSADFTSIGLIANAKRRGAIPTGSGLTTSDLLQVLSEQLRTYIPAFLKGIREEYIIAELDIPVTSEIVPIPARACGIALRTVSWRLSDGTLGPPLPRIEPERRGDYAGISATAPCGYMFRGNNCVLLPSVTSGTLVVSYQQRPGQLVLPTDCGVIDSWVNSTTLLIAGTPPDSIAPDVICDIVSHSPNFSMLAMDVTVVSVTPSGPDTLVVLSSAPATAMEGDFLCLAGETPIPQLPYECFDLLAQAATWQIASSTGSTRANALKDALKEVRDQTTMLLSPRSDGSARVVVSRSRLGHRRY